MQDFRRLLHRLADSGPEFVIVGGYAAVTHGSSLVTRDLDICAVLSEGNIERLREILAEWHPKHRMTPEKLSFLDFPKSGPLQNLYLLTDVGILDILSTVLGVGDFARLKQAAEDPEKRDKPKTVADRAGGKPRRSRSPQTGIPHGSAWNPPWGSKPHALHKRSCTTKNGGKRRTDLL
jgi:hypothetical protein